MRINLWMDVGERNGTSPHNVTMCRSVSSAHKIWVKLILVHSRCLDEDSIHTHTHSHMCLPLTKSKPLFSQHSLSTRFPFYSTLFESIFSPTSVVPLLIASHDPRSRVLQTTPSRTKNFHLTTEKKNTKSGPKHSVVRAFSPAVNRHRTTGHTLMRAHTHHPHTPEAITTNRIKK